MTTIPISSSRTGHDRRIDDIDRLATLGVSAVRYPVLWERTAPDPNGPADWEWSAGRLARLRRLGVRPIVGLVHHGSGPPHTSLTDPAFPRGLAAFAAQVARHYPWVDAFTPVNEPLTTARFSCLYGHWYPHSRHDWAFATALLNQCRAIVMSMAAIRQINPAAALVQTEDFGHTHAPPRLAYQAEFENQRRWITWDLFCGRVGCGHPVWDYFRWAGISESKLSWFLDHPCPPDVLGVNYYVTSERYLDDRLDLYPLAKHGGNGRERYVDVEAVRILPEGLLGASQLLRQAWERYRLPVAITEAHLGCTREEQLRWWRDVWAAACQARAEGADVRAVTAWSAFGAFDWDSLVTRERGHYEPGSFDVRSDPPRSTALADLVRESATGAQPDHPVLDGVGWWQRPSRFLFPDAVPATSSVQSAAQVGNHRGDRNVGPGVRPGLRGSRTGVCITLRRELDIADRESVAAALDTHKPWALINAAGYVRVDDAEIEPDRCRRENAIGPAVLAAVCAARGIELVTFSSDLVFDGRAGRPYRELDPVAPLNVYGTTKAEAERAVLNLLSSALVIRTSAFFSPWDEHNFVAHALKSLRGGSLFAAADDITVTPSYVPDLVNATLDLLIDGANGVWHLANPDPITWADLARSAADLAGFDRTLVLGRPATSFGWRAPRPSYTPLVSERGCTLPPLAESLSRLFHEYDSCPAF